jgi:hypothetical protein
MYLAENYKEKWDKVINHPDLAEIKDPYRRDVTLRLLENQEQYLKEAAPTNATGGSIDNWNPILMTLVRRAMPNMMAYDVCGVQPMTGPTGLVFAMKSRYASQGGAEALHNEADTDFSSENAAGDTNAVANDQHTNWSNADNPFVNDTNKYGKGMTRAQGEALGDASGNRWAEMAFSIERTSVEAQTRALKADYSMELAQDLKAIHGLDAETELANILSTEILNEINREVIRTVYQVARKGSQANVANAGIFDLDTDSNGRWSVEKFKGMMFNMERDAHLVAKSTRRGKANFVICSSDVASAMAMAGTLDYNPALQNNMNVDDTQNTYVGNWGSYKVYVDPYWNDGVNSSNDQYYVVGYKGSSAYDAGVFYCPYVPLQMVRAIGEETFQPKIGFKTRYGMIGNPFQATGVDGQVRNHLDVNANDYYRKTLVKNLM